MQNHSAQGQCAQQLPRCLVTMTGELASLRPSQAQRYKNFMSSLHSIYAEHYSPLKADTPRLRGAWWRKWVIPIWNNIGVLKWSIIEKNRIHFHVESGPVSSPKHTPSLAGQSLDQGPPFRKACLPSATLKEAGGRMNHLVRLCTFPSTVPDGR